MGLFNYKYVNLHNHIAIQPTLGFEGLTTTGGGIGIGIPINYYIEEGHEGFYGGFYPGFIIAFDWDDGLLVPLKFGLGYDTGKIQMSFLLGVELTRGIGLAGLSGCYFIPIK